MKYKKVIYIVKEALHMYPPCISQIFSLKDEGMDVLVICGECNQNLVEEFNKRNIKCIIVGNQRVRFRCIGKIYSYIKFRFSSWKIIKKENTNNTILWLGTADGAIALTGKYKKKTYVLSILELYDKYPFYRFGLSKIIGDATAVIACEETRAKIMKTWWDLKEIPYVMPNKPYAHPRIKNQEPTTKELEIAIAKIKQKKIILYQGIISADRDLVVLAKALNKMKSDYTLVLIGKSFYNGVEKVKEIYKDTIYLGFFPAPLHLQITSYANIGIANYDDSSINNLFCAPNKIYEYTGFSVPILGSNVPGLANTIGTSLAGECVDFKDEKSIIKGIKKIECNYKLYQDNANRFYESVDNKAIIKKLLMNITNKGIEIN